VAGSKGRSRRRRRSGKTALVLAGGGVTGAVYEIGCLRGLEEMLDRSVLDMDLYVGISGGAVVASLLANGFSPREMYDELVSPSPAPLGVGQLPLFRLGSAEYLRRGLRAPRVLSEAVKAALSGEGRSLTDVAAFLTELLPAGLLDNSGIQEYLARLFASRGKSDRFARLRRELYIVGVDLDGGEAVPFGEGPWRSVPISRAVQASTALPGLYRPVRIAGRDFVDGGVKKTAHINLAIRHGADLVICVNPIVPILNDTAHGPLNGHLSNRGLSYVLDQVFRIVLHGRMQYGMERYQHEHPEVDILLVEPMRGDMRMFRYNIMRMSARQVVAQYGYRSVRNAATEHQARWRRTLRKHEIGLARPQTLPPLPPPHPLRSTVARTLGASLDLLESELARA
jgi:NTE family protein